MAISTLTTTRKGPRAAPEARTRRALEAWAAEAGWQLAYLPASGGERPERTLRGIVDAVLVRTSPHDPDAVQIRLVQLRGGKAGLAPAPEKRLERAAERVEIEVLHVYGEAGGLCFSAPFLPAWHPRRRA